MPKTENNKIIEDRFAELPQVIQKIITDSGWQFKIRDLVKKFNIRVDQGGAIENEILLVMLDFENPENFVQNIMNGAQLDQKTAESLATEVGLLIFDPIREALIAETNSEKNALSGGSSGSVVQPLESREDLLKQIEDPTEIPDIKPSTMKANASVAATPTVSASINVATAPVTSIPETPRPTAPKIDPYREPIE